MAETLCEYQCNRGMSLRQFNPSSNSMNLKVDYYIYISLLLDTCGRACCDIIFLVRIPDLLLGSMLIWFGLHAGSKELSWLPRKQLVSLFLLSFRWSICSWPKGRTSMHLTRRTGAPSTGQRTWVRSLCVKNKVGGGVSTSSVVGQVPGFDPQHITQQLTASGSCPELQTPQALVDYVCVLGEV